MMLYIKYAWDTWVVYFPYMSKKQIVTWLVLMFHIVNVS